MTNSNFSLKSAQKSLAGSLVVALLVTAPGPLAYQAAAQTMVPARVVTNTGPTGALAISGVGNGSAATMPANPLAFSLAPALTDTSAPAPMIAAAPGLAATRSAAVPAALASAHAPAAATSEQKAALVEAAKLGAQIKEATDPDAIKAILDRVADGSSSDAALAAATLTLPVAIGKDRVGAFSGRQAVWEKIAELQRTQSIGFVVVTDSAKEHYGLNRGNYILKGRANEIDHDGFRKRAVSPVMPHAALMLFIGEAEPVDLFIDVIGDYKVAKIVKSGAAYSGELAPFDALQRAQKSTKAAMRAPTAEEIADSTPTYDIGPVKRLFMQAMGAIWWVTDRLLDSKWDKLPILLRTKYLFMNMQYLRLKVWDANRAAVRVGAPATADQVLYRSGNGANFDPSRPDIGKSHVSNFTRIGVPQAPAPVDEKALETAKKAARLEARKINPQTGRPEIIEAGILNVHAASWIQFMVHDWMNHKRRPAAEDPFLIALDKDDPLRAQGFTHMKLDRTEKGGLVDSVPVFRNELTPGWDLSMIYGATDEIQATVRTFKDGKIKVDEKNKRLLEDPRNPGLPLTGMNDNLTPPLAFLHTLFHLEHNAVAEALKAEHRDWNDEEIFQIARLRLIALAAKIHTVEWTRALLPQDGLQVGMWVDWYGFVDKRLKGWVMRISNRRPTLGKILGKILRHEGIFGVPGTHTFHFGKDYAMPEEFVDVYRLHTMIRDYYKMQKLAADENGNVSIEVTLDVPLEDMVGVTETGRFKPQDFSEKFPMAEQAVSFAAQSAGALTLQNMPLGLRRLHTQDDQHKNLAIVHTLRTSERSEAKTYVKFTMKLGEKPPKTFLELTGGNAEIAKLLEDTFGTVDQVPFRAGILAERKPKGFALGNRQFKVFVLMAPRRLVSDKFLSKMYDAKYYGGQSGIDYVENTTMSDMVIRHFPETRPAFEGIDNFFKPTPPPGTQAERAIEAAQKTSEAIAGSDIVLTTTLLRAALKAVQAGKKDSALMFLRMAEKRGASDVRKRKVAVLALTTGIAALLLAISAITPIWTWAVVALGAGTLFTGVSTWKKINQLKDDLRNVRIILQSRIREGLPKIDPATLPGETAIQKRYWFLLEGKTVPVATFGDSYKALRRSGLPALKSFVTAALSHLGFARKTQRNMTAEERSRFKPGFFDIYVPNIIDAQDYSNSRIYMSRATARAKGLKPGDVDMDEFARQAREAGMRLYFTAYDLARLREYNALRDKREGRGTWFQRIKGRLAAKRRADQLLDLFADRVVWQEAKFGKLAPAISLERLLEFYQGSAQQELLNERR